jgi:gliding motility-associated-like protein
MKKIILILTLFLTSGLALAQEGFEGSATSLPAGWNQYQNAVGLAQTWSITNSSALVCFGSNAAQVNRENLNYTGTPLTSEDYLVTPLFNVPSNGQFRFTSKQGLLGDQGGKYQLKISTNPDKSILSAYVLVKEWTENEMNAIANVCQEQKVSIPATYTGQAVYLALVKVTTQTSAAIVGDRWVVDNIDLVSECVAPTAISSSNIAGTSATLNWTNPSGGPQWGIAYVANGGTFAAATQITVSATTTPAVTTVGGVRSYVLGGLSFGTPYQFWIRSMCTATNTSDWIGPFNFQTLALGTVCADPIVVTSPLPYQDTNNTGNFADLVDAVQSNSALCGATPATTNYMAGNDVFYRYTATASGLISIRLTPTSPNASVFVYPSCPTTGACLAGVANNTSNVRLINNFAVVAGTSYTIVISSALPTQTVGYTLLIQQENCTAPVGNTPTNITTTSADLSWSNPTGASSWQVAVQPLGSSVPTTAGVTVTATSYTAPLQPATQYQYWVRSECAPGVFSSWAGPYVFNTLICNPADRCNHTFRMFNASTGGFNGARMEVRQNGILVTTIGATYTAGASNNVVVPLCPGVPFELFWTVAGTAPLNCGVSIINTFGQTIFTKPAGSGSAGQQVYTNTVNCTTPVCNIAPATTAATVITTSGATLNWTSPATTNFDIFIVPFGDPAPTSSSVPTYANVGPLTAPFSFATTLPLLADTRYTYYVRVVCAPEPSPWSNGTTFNTLPTCTRPLNLGANSITTTSAVLTWSNANVSDSAWEILLVPSPTATLPLVLPPVNPTVGNGTLLFTPINSASPFLATGLSPATIYFYYVRTVCSSSDKSTWAGPFVFNTVLCADADKCVYRFVLTSTAGGWNSGRMQIRQNGIVVTTIGATIGTGTGPTVVNVALCTNVPFDVFWSVAGTAPDRIGLSIQNPFTDVLYTKAPDSGTPLTVLYAGTANCTPPTCQKPTVMSVANITATSAQLNWTQAGTATQWEVYAVPILNHTPPVNGSPVSTAPATPPFYLVNALPFVLPNLTPATNYVYYVRAVCSSSDASTWTLLNPIAFTTKAINDDCSDAITLTVNPTRVCAVSTPGNTRGATASAPLNLPGTGCGTSDDDVWFKFTATNNIHLININNVVGTPTNVTLNHSLFTGDCTTPNLLYCSNTVSSVASGLVPNQVYYIRVYTAGSTAGQTATFNLCVTTPPAITNDNCDTALLTPVNSGLLCTTSASGSLTGASASPNPNTCVGTADDDVWFKFVATATTHYFELKNVIGTTTNINHSVYSGTCTNLSLIYCSAANSLNSNNNTFVIGNTYYIRVWSNAATLQDVSFDMCIGRILPPITVNNTQYTNFQLIEDVLLQTTCANVSNVTASTGTNFGSTNGIGYFNKSLSDFQFEEGIVLTTGNALRAPGPNTATLSDGAATWPGDAQLEAIVLAGTGTPMVSQNATKLEFDFVPISNEISFNFIFASEEYGGFQCGFSDSFAFILTNLTTGVSNNLAVIPNTTTPVSVVTIRNNIHNAGCNSQNPTFFDTFFGATGTNPLGAPINFNGVTVPMTASASVNPNQNYRIKMVIADRQDSLFDSAVFLEGGSFNIGNISLGNDFLTSAGNAICFGNCTTLNSNLDPANYTIKWFLNGVLIPGATGPTYQACVAGVYKIEAQYLSTSCIGSDTITVEYFSDAAIGTPANLKLCDASGFASFNLEQNTATILSPFSAPRPISYHLTQADADNNVNPITNTSAYTNISNPQTIYVRVTNPGTTCKQTTSFTLTVQDLTPVYTVAGNLTKCPTGSTTVSVLPTNNNFSLSDATYSWTFNGNPIAGQTASSLIISGANTFGNYTVTVDREGCKTTESFTISNANTVWNYTLTGNLTKCPLENTTISVLPTNNSFNLNAATYSWTFDGNPIAGQTGSSLLISGPNSYGNYTVTVDIEGCATTNNFVISNANTVWNFTIISPTTAICATQTVQLSFSASNFVATNPAAIYTWTAPNGATSNGLTLNANQVGTYSLQVNILGCTTTKTIALTANTSPIPMTLNSGCEGNSFRLEAVPVNGSFNPANVTYAFAGPEVVLIPGTPNKVILKKPGTYTVTVTTIPDGCTSTDSINIPSVTCAIQQGISPNGDGKNDSFDLSTLGVDELEIFNRYGTRVYNLANYTNQWFGQSNSGDTLPDGTYFYVIKKKDGENLTGWIYINK